MKNEKSQRRANRIRNRIRAQKSRPRLSVFRSLRYIYAQVIDDVRGVTVCAASQKGIDSKSKNKTAAAAEVGKLIAQKAKSKKIKQVVFDRGPYAYAGRVRALAQAARENGLEF